MFLRAASTSVWGDVCQRVEKAGWDTCFVVDKTGVVIGRLGRGALRGDRDLAVDEAMTPGPSTVRPSARLEAMVKRMREQKLSNLPVTTSDGRLVGLLVREDVERANASGTVKVTAAPVVSPVMGPHGVVVPTLTRVG
jgi:CBS domain-containing protein